MTQPIKPDLSEHDEEAIPFDDVMRQLVGAKPQSSSSNPAPDRKAPEDADE